MFLKDQDGTFFKLIEEIGAPPTGGPDLVRYVNTNMNVADLERSREFYRLLGFTEEEDGSQKGSGAFAKAHGLKGLIEFEGVDEVYSVTGEWDLVPVSRSHAGSWSQMSSPNGSPRWSPITTATPS